MDHANVRTIHHHSELGYWELIFGTPHPRLRDDVRAYEGYQERYANFGQRLEVASSDVPVIISFGSGYLIEGPGQPAGGGQHRSSFVAGLYDHQVLVGASGPQYCLQINFTPLGAHRFFGVPMHELRNRTVQFEDVLGPAGSRLIERLEAAPGWPERFAMLDAVITERIERSTAITPGVAWAWRQLEISGGNSNVGLLAEEIGCSRKHLIAQFHEQVGMPPKKLGRILRFNRAIRMTNLDREPNWGAIARQCGFYDQAHLIREFRQFAGLTPTEYKLRLLPDDSGVIGGEPGR